MVDLKISGLDELTTAAGSDILVIVDDPGGSAETKKITVTNLAGENLIFAKVVKTADETVNSSITLQDDDELKFTTNANKTYSFILFILTNSGGGPKFKHAMTLPSGATGLRTGAILRGDAPTVLNDVTSVRNIATTGSDEYVIYSGRIIVAGTSGVVTFQWAQQVSNASDTKVLKGSYWVVWEE